MVNNKISRILYINNVYKMFYAFSVFKHYCCPERKPVATPTPTELNQIPSEQQHSAPQPADSAAAPPNSPNAPSQEDDTYSV